MALWVKNSPLKELSELPKEQFLKRQQGLCREAPQKYNNLLCSWMCTGGHRKGEDHPHLPMEFRLDFPKAVRSTIYRLSIQAQVSLMEALLSEMLQENPC